MTPQRGDDCADLLRAGVLMRRALGALLLAVGRAVVGSGVGSGGRLDAVGCTPTRIEGSLAMQRRNWALLTLAAAEGAELTPVQLQKVLFLLGDRQRDKVGRGFYSFHPYNFGPFSADVYADADQLEVEGLAQIARGAPGRSWSLYAATPDGLARAREVASQAPQGLPEYIARLVKWARSLTFQELVSAVYSAYPEQRRNSIFVG